MASAPRHRSWWGLSLAGPPRRARGGGAGARSRCGAGSWAASTRDGAHAAQRGQQPAAPSRLAQGDPWQRPGPGGGGSGGGHLGLPAPRALGTLRRRSLASWPHSSAGLALPADWQEHRMRRHTAQELGRMGGLQQLESWKYAPRASIQATRHQMLLVCRRMASASGRLAAAAPAPMPVPPLRANRKRREATR
jgi:hypothetical protein